MTEIFSPAAIWLGLALPATLLSIMTWRLKPFWKTRKRISATLAAGFGDQAGHQLRPLRGSGRALSREESPLC